MGLTKNTTKVETISGTKLAQQAWDKKSNSPARRRRRSIIREFALNTSTHGLPGIARSQTKHNRIFWTLSFLSFTGVMSFFIFRTIAAYFDYPTQTSLSLVIEKRQNFPAVTICNYSPVRSDLLLPIFFNYTDANNITNPTQSRIITPQLANMLRRYLLRKVNANQSVKEYFFTLDMMMITCTFNNVSCSVDDFTSFESADHGMCYTFNARQKKTTNHTVRQIVQNGGPGLLKLQLYAHSHLYVPFGSEGKKKEKSDLAIRLCLLLNLCTDVSAGIVAMIHDNTELPLIDIAGIHLTPGLKHKLGYKKRENHFLQAPYTDCTDTISPAMRAMFDKYADTDYAYSQDLCYLICQQTYV